MIPVKKFQLQSKEFWANIRIISQQVGYTQKRVGRKKATENSIESKIQGDIKIQTLVEIKTAFEKEGLEVDHLITKTDKATALGRLVIEYFAHRAMILNQFVRAQLMNKESSHELFQKLHKQLCPGCPLPLNKQKGDKRAPAYFTGIINMLIESNSQGMPCDYDPRQLTTITHKGKPFRTLARRVDGAFPGPVDPIAIWEIKEYYYTTTFGSRVADGVYESLLDGMELEELRKTGRDVKHYLMIDDYFTWWQCGRSYLCRIVDMLHMGYVDEVLVGKEVVDRLPAIVKQWVKTAKQRRK
jgi:hypothetical protein